MPRRLPALNEAVESFLRQTWERRELIIVNDTSCVTLKYDHPQVRILDLPVRCGSLGDKYNAGVRAAQGSIICIWDDDDISLPWRMEQSVQLLETHSAELISPNRIWVLSGKAGSGREEWKHKVRDSFAFSTGAYRKSAWQAIGGYLSISSGEDGQFRDAIVARGKVVFDEPRTAFIYRWQDGQLHVSTNGEGETNYKSAANLSVPGTYQISPRWEIDYAAKVNELVSHSRVARERTGRFCYFSCSTTEDGAAMIETMIQSARAVGVSEDFHACAPRPLAGAIVHPFPFSLPRSWTHMEKTLMLRDVMQPLDFDYFVWLDSDNFFVRHPGDLQSLIRNNKVWALMESDMQSPGNRWPDWHGPSYPQHASAMRKLGVKHKKLYTTNGGMFIVRKEAIPEFAELMFRIFNSWVSLGFRRMCDEPALAVAGHLMVENPDLNSQANCQRVWACDWAGFYQDQIPNGNPWTWEDWVTGQKASINPAIVHAMRSKMAMKQAACRLV